jgi:hypothetical protein
MLSHGRLIVILAVAALVCCGAPPRARDLVDGAKAATFHPLAALRRGSLSANPHVDPRTEPDYDAIAAQLEVSEEEQGKRYLKRAADGVFKFSAGVAIAAGLGLVAGAFFGGVGRRGCLVTLAIAGCGVWLGYFITVHGYLVSEFISWCIIVGVFITLPVGMFIVARSQWDAHVGRRLAAKRADAADDGRDAISKLAVPQKVRSELHAAWETVRKPATEAPERVFDAASRLLRKYKLQLPASVGAVKGPRGPVT